MTIACILITHLRAKAELKRQPDLADKPTVIVERRYSRAGPTVVDRFPNAPSASVGLSLEKAVSLDAGIIVLEADETHYRQVFNGVVSALQGVSDRVERGDLGVAYARTDGLERLYRGEAGVACALLKAAPEHLGARVGVAEGKFPAFVAALSSPPLGASRVPEDAAGFLAPVSVDLLPASPDARARMRRFGLHTMGDVAAMSEATVVDQFGAEGHRIWMLCNGTDDTPLAPLPYEESIVEHISMPFSSTSTEMLLTAIDALLKRAYSRPDLKGRNVGAASIRCAVFGAPSWEKTINFKRPPASWEDASFAVRSLMETDRPNVPIEDVTLTLSRFGSETGAQLGMMEHARQDRSRRLVEVDRRLRERYNACPEPAERGDHSLYRVVEVAPWHPAPEMRALRVPVEPSASDLMKPLYPPIPVSVREGPQRQPTAVLFKRGQMHNWARVVRIADLWSFDLWWLPQPVTRVYYRVDSADGERLTIFRDRLDGQWYRQRA